jgi:fucose 4-O-acetylase-like acetyltransferase
VEKQNNIVTLAKAFGIIFMVLGHTIPQENVIWRVIYTFHMPLFFIMSGYCFKEKYLNDAKQFVMRKIKGIYVPFVLFSLPFLALHNVFCRWNIYDPDWLYGWKEFAWHTSRIVTRMSHNEELLGTFWFLKELFWGSLIFYATYRSVKKVLGHWTLEIGKYRTERVTVIGLLVLAEMMCIFKLRIPYFTVSHKSVLAACFIAAGYWWKQADWQINKFVLWIGGVSAITAEILLLHQVSFTGVSPTSLPIYVIPAIAGTMLVYELCRWLVDSRNKIVESLARGLEYVGKHTLAIMALHMLSFKLVTYTLIRLNHLPIERLMDFPVLYEYTNGGGALFAYAFVGICFPLVCVWAWQWGFNLVKSEK